MPADGSPERFGRYLIMRHMSEPSGMGTLAISFDTHAKRLVVLKRVRAPQKNPQNAIRLKEEVGVNERLNQRRQLRHDHIVQSLDAGELDGEPYIAFELVLGKNLDDISERGRLLETLPSGPVAALIVRQVCRGLEHAHEVPGLGFVHRDISPANIMVSFDGIAKLLDFGLALSSVKRSRTMPGFVTGTPGFLSPEQRRGEPLDARTDLYSLGGILYFLLSTRLPYNPRADGAAEAPRLASLPGLNVHPLLDEIVARALLGRGERYQTARELGEALDQFLAEQPADPSDTARYVARIFPNDEQESLADAAKLLADGEAWALVEPARGLSASSTAVVEPLPPPAAPPDTSADAEGRARAKTLIIPGIEAPRRRGVPWVAAAVVGGIAGLVIVAAIIIAAMRSHTTEPAPAPPTPRATAPAPAPAPPAPTPPAPAPHREEAPPPAVAAPAPVVRPTVNTEIQKHRNTERPAGLEPAGAPAKRNAHVVDQAAANATLERARVEFTNDQYAKAIASTTQAIRLGAGAAAFKVRADAELRLGKRADAARDFRTVLHMDPGNDDARAGLKAANE